MWRDGVDNSHLKPLSAQQHRPVCPPAQTPHISTVYPNRQWNISHSRAKIGPHQLVFLAVLGAKSESSSLDIFGGADQIARAQKRD